MCVVDVSCLSFTLSIVACPWLILPISFLFHVPTSCGWPGPGFVRAASVFVSVCSSSCSRHHCSPQPLDFNQVSLILPVACSKDSWNAAEVLIRRRSGRHTGKCVHRLFVGGMKMCTRQELSLYPLMLTINLPCQLLWWRSCFAFQGVRVSCTLSSIGCKTPMSLFRGASVWYSELYSRLTGCRFMQRNDSLLAKLIL